MKSICKVVLKMENERQIANRIAKIFIILAIIFAVIEIGNSQEIDTLVVTPFKVIGDTTDCEIYSYGLPDAIANDLSNVPGLIVIERLKLSTIFQEIKLSQAGFIDAEYAPKIGKLTGAKIIIVGTVQKRGQEVRVQARAVNSTTGKIMFGVKIEKTITGFKDLFELEDNLAQKIIKQLVLKQPVNQCIEYKKIPTHSEDAFKYYSYGLKLFDRGDYNTGLIQMQKAIDTDKDFYQAQTVRDQAKKAFEELEKEIRNKPEYQSKSNLKN
jgi:TolB-like protein